MLSYMPIRELKPVLWSNITSYLWPVFSNPRYREEVSFGKSVVPIRCHSQAWVWGKICSASKGSLSPSF